MCGTNSLTVICMFIYVFVDIHHLILAHLDTCLYMCLLLYSCLIFISLVSSYGYISPCLVLELTFLLMLLLCDAHSLFILCPKYPMLNPMRLQREQS